MNIVVFYSWQSKTNEKRNRYYIKDAIDSALKSITKKKDPIFADISFELQEGTSGLSGMPDIPATIDERISNCDIYICDLSVINGYKFMEKVKYALSPRTKKRELPISSNVLLEFGQARHAVGDSRIIAVMNTDIEDPKKYPNIILFDINERRHPIFYSPKKKDLKEKLRVAIESAAIEAIKLREDKYKPFVTWIGQESKINKAIPFINCDKTTEIISQIRNNIADLRILGLSGIGKTRVVWEAFRNSPERSYSNSYLYYDYVDETKERAYAKLESIFSSKVDGQCVVIDNCPREFAKKILALRSSAHSDNRIITLYNEPEEFGNQIDNIQYITISGADMDHVVDIILSEVYKTIPEEKKKIIKDFSSGLPMMAEIMADNFKKDEDDITSLPNSDFVDRLLISADSDEIEMMKSLSLFKYIGYKDDLRHYIDFIMSDTNITPSISGDSDYRIAVFDKSFNKYAKREIFEIRGRLLGVRPRPLSFFLAKKWFDACPDYRLLKVVDAIQHKDAECGGRILTEALCEQIRYLTHYDKALQLVQTITKANSPFANAEVLNTELGSRLFRSFVEVDPVSVADLLWRVFGEMTASELLNIRDGRRNLVWTIQKLCFDKRTFIIGAKLLIMFGLAENETWGNNATNEVLNLFHIYLPGTEADLKQRLEIIKWVKTIDGADEMLFNILSSSLSSHDYTYMCGAEMQGTNRLEHYSPSGQEIIEYWENIVLIIKEIIMEKPQAIVGLSNVVSKNFNGLVRIGAKDIAFDIAEFVADKRQWDWEELRENIRVMFWRGPSQEMPDVLTSRLKGLMNRLTKDDFISRLKDVEHFDGGDWKEELEKRNELYKQMAIEFVEKENASTDLMVRILNDSSLKPYATFGFELYKQICGNIVQFQQLTDSMISALSTNKDYSNNTMIGFLGHTSEEDFNYAYDIVFKKLPEALFILFAVRKESLEKCQTLFKLVEDSVAQVEAFDNFCAYYDWSSCRHEDIITFFNKLARLSEKGSKIAMNRLHSILYFDTKDQQYSYLLDTYRELITTEVYPICFNEEKYLENIELAIEKYYSPDVASFISKHLVSYFMTDRTSIHNNGHYLDSVLSVMFDKYFDVVWPDWREKLTDPQNIGFAYLLKFKLGHSIGGLTGGALFGVDHSDALKQWCVDFPDTAPIILAMYCPVYAGSSLSQIAKYLIDNYGGNKRVLSELSCNLGSFSCVGSAVPIYERKITALKELVPHSNSNVNQWLLDNIKYAENDIARENDRDAEDRILYR